MLFHPRLYNSDLYDHNVPYVNINDGYNNPPELEMLINRIDMADYICNVMKGYHFKYPLISFQTVGKDGYIRPVQKWLIETVFNISSYEYMKELHKPILIDSIPTSPINHEKIIIKKKSKKAKVSVGGW
jgi:hypothetical protein